MKRGLKCEVITAAEDDNDFFDDPQHLGSPYSNFCSSDRKKRRGIIEKRRRDRINTSLSDLKRLVPDACNKQNSAKLEKAEILQITVDFLRRLHQEGYVLMAETRAAENRRLGFHECLTEVSRFISTQTDENITTTTTTTTSASSNYLEDFKRRLIGHLQVVGQKRDHDMKAYLEATAQQQQQHHHHHQQSNPDQDQQTSNGYSTNNGYTNNYSHDAYNDHTSLAKDVVISEEESDNRSLLHHNNLAQQQPHQQQFYHHHLHQQQPTQHQTSLQNESQSTTSPSLVGTLEETDISTTPPNLRSANSSCLQALMNQVYNNNNSSSSTNNSTKLEGSFECSSPTSTSNPSSSIPHTAGSGSKLNDFWLNGEPSSSSSSLSLACKNNKTQGAIDLDVNMLNHYMAYPLESTHVNFYTAPSSSTTSSASSSGYFTATTGKTTTNPGNLSPDNFTSSSSSYHNYSGSSSSNNNNYQIFPNSSTSTQVNGVYHQHQQPSQLQYQQTLPLINN